MSSDKFSVVNQAVVDLLKSNWDTLGFSSPDDIYYGDQARYPRTPSAAVQGSSLERELYQTGGQTLNDMSIFVMIFHSPYANLEVSQKQTDEFAEAVEGVLHQNRTLDGILIHSHVSTNEPGVAERGGTLLRATRLTLSCVSKTYIGG